MKIAGALLAGAIAAAGVVLLFPAPRQEKFELASESSSENEVASHRERQASPFQKDVERYLEGTMDRLKRLSRFGTVDCDDCDVSTTQSSVLDQRSCPDGERDLYAELIADPARTAVHITAVFGYLDGPPVAMPSAKGDGEQFVPVYDRDLRNAFIAQLIKPCAGKSQACGFRQSPDDADLFSKEIILPSTGQRKTIRIRVISSSATVNDDWNRTPPAPGTGSKTPLSATVPSDHVDGASDGGPCGPESSEGMTTANNAYCRQLENTEYAKRALHDGLRYDDIVIYNGHARLCGGPDTAPPIRKPGSTAVNYGDVFYRNRTNFKELLQALGEAPKPPALVAILGCDAFKCFGEELKRTSEGTAFVLSEGLTQMYASSMQQLALIDSVLAGRCVSGMENAMKVKAFVKGQPVQPVRMEGFRTGD